MTAPPLTHVAARPRARHLDRGIRTIVAGLALLALGGVAPIVGAATCVDEDYVTRVGGDSGCLLMRRFGVEDPVVMVVWIHGNVSTGGPANSHFRVAEKLAADSADSKLLVVALVRPGYPDGTGATSSGNANDRIDNWQRATIADVGVAIARLRERFKPVRAVLAGHSGGAALSAVLLAMMPGLADAALLVGCPCDVAAWRAGRSGRAWASESPIRWVDDVPVTARIVALTGSRDATTPPALAQDYVAALRRRGIDASFVLVPDAGHVEIIGLPVVAETTRQFLRR